MTDFWRLLFDISISLKLLLHGAAASAAFETTFEFSSCEDESDCDSKAAGCRYARFLFGRAACLSVFVLVGFSCLLSLSLNNFL